VLILAFSASWLAVLASFCASSPWFFCSAVHCTRQYLLFFFCYHVFSFEHFHLDQLEYVCCVCIVKMFSRRVWVIDLLLYPYHCTAFSFIVPPWQHLNLRWLSQFVWRLRGNIIRIVLYIANVLPLQWAKLTKTVHTARLGRVFSFFYVAWFFFVCVCFVLPWTVE